MLVIEFTILFYMISSNNFAGAFECREQESMTACEVRYSINSLITMVCEIKEFKGHIRKS